MNQDNIDLSKTEAIKCDMCQGEVFAEGLIFRKASRFLTNTLKDTLVPIQTMFCVKCQHVNDEFLPEELKSKIV